MFQRIVTGSPEAVCTVVAFAVASSIFVGVAWRAIRMKTGQSERLSSLPFSTPTPASVADPSDEKTTR